MPIQFSDMEQSIIKNMMLRKPYKEISDMLECGIEDVSAFINTEMRATGLVSWQAKLEQKKLLKSPKVKKASTKKEIKVKVLPSSKSKTEQDKAIKIEAYKKSREIQIQQQNNRRRPPNYKTIEVDYTKLVTIRIDRTTTIYSKPGQEEETKKRFLKHYQKPIDRYDHPVN